MADPSPTARTHAEAAGLRAYADPLEMIEREPLDAVSICTPPVNHPELAIACLKRGLARALREATCRSMPVPP